MAKPLISSYTPSNTDPEVLERIFVQREKLLHTIVRRLERSVTSGNQQHILLIGPRGSGKTHFLTLAHFRLTQNEELTDRLRIAWLGEDTVITGLIDLALEVTSQLANDYPDEFDIDFRSPVQGLPPDDAAEAMLNRVIGILGDRELLVLMENLDRAFSGLGQMGQRKWRAFLQETSKISTLSSSQQLFSGVSSRDEAFFGFFDIHHLDPLSVEHATRLIAKVATEYGNDDLVTFLQSDEGRYRVRALRHLAGGNHRMYILLSEFLTRESLDDLVTAFEQLAEELTPYFQERLRALSPQQARLVQALCNADGATTVKAIAETTFIPERSCSKQLGELKQKGYVTSQRRGKESYYEMAEPLMRLCLEVKNQRGRPLQLLARFLRAWFPLDALQPESDVSTTPSQVDQYRSYALTLDNSFEKAIQQELAQEIQDRLTSKSFDEALALADELACADPIIDLNQRAKIHFLADDYVAAISDLTDLLEMPDAPADLRAEALANRRHMHWKKGDFKLAADDCMTLIETTGFPASIRKETMFYLPEAMIPIRSWTDSMAALERAFEEGDPEAGYYGGTPRDLLKMVLRKGHREWGEYVSDLVRIYENYGASAKLGNGLTRTIADLDEGDVSDTQLDAWKEAWHEAGQGIEELEIPLRSLDCAVRAIKTGSDRPLFDLPLEIRELVAPLLKSLQ